MTESKPEEEAASRLPIAIDAMGGDHAPEVIVAGVIAASQRGLGSALLYGNKKLLDPIVRSLGGLPPTVELRDAPAVIEMGDPAAWAARTKKESSIHLGLRAVRD